MAARAVPVAGRTELGSDLGRVPLATVTQWNQLLAYLKGRDLRRPVTCPPAVKTQTWDQLRAALTALVLVDNEMVPNLRLQRLVRGELSQLDVMANQYGAWVRADDPAEEFLERTSTLAETSRKRFRAILDMARVEAGLPCIEGPSRRRSPPAGPSEPARSLRLLPRQEGELYLEKLRAALDTGHYGAAREIQRLLHEFYRFCGVVPLQPDVPTSEQKS